jgi:multiple sugar transport system ATP-binding protein
MADLRLVHLTKHFGTAAAVHDFSLEVLEGELMCLLGPSGCGKTTTMRMIAGLEQPTAGEIYIAGERMDDDIPTRARGIAMVFQSYALYPHKTVGQNIAFPLEAAGMARAAVQERVRAGAGMFGIPRLLRRFPRQLSGGERQRVALARATVRDPRVFLFDEPLSNLDARLRSTARFELKQLQKRLGTTTIYVTHDQVEAMGLGDRIAVMNNGKMLQVGPPERVYEHPADTFVATFLGAPPMNLIEMDAQTLLGFRPERFLPREVFGPHDDVAVFQFRARHVEHLGAIRLIHGSLDERTRSDQIVIASLPVTAAAAIVEGEVHEFAVARAALRYFDRATGGSRDDGSP